MYTYIYIYDLVWKEYSVNFHILKKNVSLVREKFLAAILTVNLYQAICHINGEISFPEPSSRLLAFRFMAKLLNIYEASVIESHRVIYAV